MAERLRGRTILLVEDHEDSRALFQLVLERAGASVVAVDRVSDAMQAMGSVPFDAIVSDIGLPGENGHELARRVRARAADDGGLTPMLALTAYVGADVADHARFSGFDCHVGKPVEPERLVEVLAQLCASRTS